MQILSTVLVMLNGAAAKPPAACLPRRQQPNCQPTLTS